jgi:hypothetical protein
MTPTTTTATTTTQRLFTGPIAAALISALLGVLGGMAADRVAIGSSEARIQILEAREHDMETRFVSKDEFQQFLAQIADIKQDLRDIKGTLRRDQ